MNVQLIQTETLKTLKEADGHPLLESVLVSQIETRVRPRPSRDEIQTILIKMNGAGFIMRKENELDPDNTYWLLDERGEAMATKMRL